MAQRSLLQKQVQLQVPATVSKAESSFSAVITIVNNGDTPQTINSIRVSLVEDRSQPTNGTANSTESLQKELSVITDQDHFILKPTETKMLTMTIPLNLSKLMTEEMSDNPVSSVAAHILDGLQKTVDAMDSSSFEHYVEAVANVDGIALDPSARSSIQILKPGQIGASFRL
ncbi:hypothetical protein HYS01_02800 [Candidatus Saccharibacteria bacterium]|nr:hypothetical protein [Candidatus Saccharibacteria bacterium]